MLKIILHYLDTVSLETKIDLQLPLSATSMKKQKIFTTLYGRCTSNTGADSIDFHLTLKD